MACTIPKKFCIKSYIAADARRKGVENMTTKKKVLAIALIVMMIAVASAGSFAYFTAEETAHNVITTGGIDIELVESKMDPETGALLPFENLEGVMPGEEISKIVEVENIGEAPAFVRVKVTKNIELADGVVGEPDLDLLKIDFNTDDWTLGNDGYYYYNQILEGGYISIPLFTTVTLDTAMDNMYQGCEATIDVVAEAVQSDNNGDSAITAAGWSD